MPNLDSQVRTLLATRKGHWQEVAKDTEVSHSWLSKFYRGKITNPGYQRLLELKAYLKAKR